MISGASGPNSAMTGKVSHDNYLLNEGHSSKMDALIEDVRKDVETTKRQVAEKFFSSTLRYSFSNPSCFGLFTANIVLLVSSSHAGPTPSISS
jgi:hypothetical protein